MSYDFKLVRSANNPVLEPTGNWWESRLTCNAGVLRIGEHVHLIYTAKGEDDIARLGYAKLRAIDEVVERLPYPVFAPQEWFEQDSVEDPRLCLLDGEIFMIYAGKDKDMARICESRISVENLSSKQWLWSKHRLLLPNMVSIHNRNAAYFPRRINGRYALLHRPMLMTEHVWISFSYDRIHWYNHKELLKPRPGYWDDAKVGIAGPPLEIDDGWLLVYHGVEAETWTYRLGFVILDKSDPSKLKYRCEEPILEPETSYEREGVSPNIVFSCGGFINSNNELVIYYGGADKVLCVARGKVPV